MHNLAIKKSLLILILVVPSLWYIFLKIYGSNQYELPVIQQLPKECAPQNSTFFLLDGTLEVDEINQLNRFEKHIENISLDFVVTSNECFETYQPPMLMLVDSKGQLRGFYKLDIEEIDRAIVESDLLLHLENE